MAKKIWATCGKEERRSFFEQKINNVLFMSDVSPRKKWTVQELPDGYPIVCNRNVLNDVVKDLSDDFISRTIKDNKDFINKGWRDRIIIFIQLGQNELQRRNNNIVLSANAIGLLVALIAVLFSWTSFQAGSHWESRQIEILSNQEKIQQQTLEEIKARIPM